MLSFIQFSTVNRLEIAENLVPVFLEPPKKEVKKRDPVDIDGDLDPNNDGDLGDMGDMGDMGEDLGDPNDPDFKPFNPENKYWTYYDGNPRNYMQILYKLTKINPSEFDYNKKNMNEKLFNMMSTIAQSTDTSIYFGKLTG